MSKFLSAMLAGACAILLFPPVSAQTTGTSVRSSAAAAGLPCPRSSPGSVVSEPEDLFSKDGVLRVRLRYQTRVDADGQTLFCFTSDTGAQSPTLHVKPGDELLLTLRNDLPPSFAPSVHAHAMPGMADASGMPQLAIAGEANPNCGGMQMTASSTNLHFHGANVPPVCHQDEVIKTLINAGETFHYDVHFPFDEPPGLYWYHPHIHGISEPAVQGGASGAIIVEGLEKVNPEVAGLPSRLLVIRDYLAAGAPSTDSDGDEDPPAWELSLNYVPVTSPKYVPAVIPMRPGRRELWRVLNASADTILDLQVQYDGKPQPLRVVGIDGVPTGSEDGTEDGQSQTHRHFLLAPAARVEFIVAPPGRDVKDAKLLTLSVPTGPIGDNDPTRPLASLQLVNHRRTHPSAGERNGDTLTAKLDQAGDPAVVMPAVAGPPPGPMRFAGLGKERPLVRRRLYFSEILSDPNDPDSPTNFFITVDGATPVLFAPDNPPAIVTTQGAVEEWTVENRAGENHEFHIHQIHFLVLDEDGHPIDGQYRDTVNIPFWEGKGPYPKVRLLMDFRGPTVGDFVYHCHILGHEDNGMMAIIRVLPKR